MEDGGDNAAYYATHAPDQNMHGADLTEVMADFYKDVAGPMPQGNATGNSSSTQAATKEGHAHTNDENMADGENEATASAEVVEEKKELTELEKYWKVVKDNPQDFTGWTYLLQYVEQENDLASARAAFDAFFSRYPYCYGYWKKYADLEKKHGNANKCEDVFERGLKAIPLSVDLWLHYLTFYKPQHKDDPDSEDKIKKVFERSIAAAGTEFRSDKLWEAYIEWEREIKRLRSITALYDLLLAIPTQFYSHHFERFEEHINKNNPKDVLSTDEFLKLRQDLIVAQQGGASGEETVAAPSSGDSPPPGLEGDNKQATTNEESATATATAAAVTTKKEPMTEDEEAALIRKKVIETRQTIHKANEEEVGRRWAFEEGIKRPYFHVKPLERTQLKNWRDYLDFEIENGSHERVVILFERCMIACALYEDLWLKYAKYLEGFSEEGARNVYQRACTIHLPKKPNIHIAWATFEERQNNLSVARDVLTNLEKEFPNYLPLYFRRINMERRQGREDDVESLYHNYMANTKNPQMGSSFAIKYARYRMKVKGDTPAAIKILNDAIEKDRDNPKLYMQLIDICYQSSPVNELEAIKIFDMALASDIPPDSKAMFAQRKVEFLEDFGTSILRLQDAYEEFTKLQKLYGTERKKRSLTDDSRGYPYYSDDGQKDKKAKVEMNGSAAVANSSMVSTAAPPPMPTTTDQTAYNYHNWYSQQGYGYHQAWNPYGQHYYPQ